METILIVLGAYVLGVFCGFGLCAFLTVGKDEK